MTTTTLDLAAPRATRGWARILPPLGGLGLVAGLVAALATPAGADTGETPADVVAYASSHEGWMIASVLFGTLAAALGSLFVAGLHTRLQGIATAIESTLVLVGGVVFTLAFTLCWLIWSAPLVDLPSETADALAQASAYLMIDDVGWFLFGTAGVGAALMAIPASLAALRAGIPAWLGWLGVLAGALSLLTLMFFGMFAWMAWIAGASIVLLVSNRDAA
jgi:hypothetical protein